MQQTRPQLTPTVIIRSLLFNTAFFSFNALYCFAILPLILVPRRQMMYGVYFYMHAVAFLEKYLAGITYSVEGREHLPTDHKFIVAAKHQSTWETLKLHILWGDIAVVLKRELYAIPLWGWLCRKSRQIPIDRGGRAAAMRSMIEGAKSCIAENRTIVIFPQGTRLGIGKWRPYRSGVAVLYEQLQVPMLPVAHNAGLFWPRHSFWKYPGHITVRILPAIAPGLNADAALAKLQAVLEPVAEELSLAAGGPATDYTKTA